MKNHFTFFELFLISLVLLIGCDRLPKSEYAIAYNVLTDAKNNNYEVFTMDLDGSNKKNITNLPGVEWTYHSYNDQLYFISDKDFCFRCYRLFKTNHKGAYIEKVSNVVLSDSWMSSRHNGRELIVKPSPKIDSVFYIIDLNGEVVKKLATGLPFASDPLFVNDGQQVVFRGGLTTSKTIEGFDEELFIIDVDGENRRQLTQYPVNETTAGKFNYRAGAPKLHPKEKFVSYQSFQNGKYSLFAVSLDGQEQWKLTENTQNEGWHDWSPDGKWLAIELFDNEQTQFHIGLINWETKEMKVLTDSTYQYQQSPNFVVKN